MKIYGTVKSERAMRGQGGDEYLHIEIFNSKQQVVATVEAIPEGEEKVKIALSEGLIHKEIIATPKNKVCECTDPLCAKCLVSDCQDTYCTVHPILKKLEFRKLYKK